MTLTKTKPRRISSEHRKRTGLHHKHGHDYVKTYWPYLPVLAILCLGLFGNVWLGNAHRSVLGYATDMSVQSLLNDTNMQRSSHGDSSLRLNAKLDAAAQAKANDMAARNYWSHNTPDGKTPWTFITAAGYNYVTAGENLAYGFDTAADTITGWMNSPEHRANLLSSNFREVGFGIANIANYQDTGPETLVVAMYGSPAISSPAATPVRKAAASPAVKPTTQTPAPVKTAEPITTVVPSSQAPKTTTQDADTLEPKQVRIARIQLVASDVPMSAFTLIVLGCAGACFLIIRHSLAWRKALLYGESFVLRHPLLDIAAVTFVSASIVLSHTAGLIR